MHQITTPAVVSSSSTGESSSLEWESPMHGWHDLKKNKYKMALRNRYVSHVYDKENEEDEQGLTRIHALLRQ